MDISVQSSVTSTANMAQVAGSVTTIQQQQLIQAMQTPAPAAPQEQAGKPVGNIGRNIDVRA